MLKAVSGGDLASGRRRDIEDMRKYAQRGLDYESILAEIDEQRPFNTGTTEAQAVNSLSGLPNTFTSRIEEFATEFEIEYTVLGAVDNGVDTLEAIRERVLANVRALSDDQKAAVDDAIERLVAKQVLKRDGETIQLR